MSVVGCWTNESSLDAKRELFEDEEPLRASGVEVGIVIECAELGREVEGEGREKDDEGEVRNGTGWYAAGGGEAGGGVRERWSEMTGEAGLCMTGDESAGGELDGAHAWSASSMRSIRCPQSLHLTCGIPLGPIGDAGSGSNALSR